MNQYLFYILAPLTPKQMKKRQKLEVNSFDSDTSFGPVKEKAMEMGFDFQVISSQDEGGKRKKRLVNQGYFYTLLDKLYSEVQKWQHLQRRLESRKIKKPRLKRKPDDAPREILKPNWSMHNKSLGMEPNIQGKIQILNNRLDHVKIETIKISNLNLKTVYRIKTTDGRHFSLESQKSMCLTSSCFIDLIKSFLDIPVPEPCHLYKNHYIVPDGHMKLPRLCIINMKIASETSLYTAITSSKDCSMWSRREFRCVARFVDSITNIIALF